MSEADIELELYLGQKLSFDLVDTAEMAIFWGQSLLRHSSAHRILTHCRRYSGDSHHRCYYFALVGKNSPFDLQLVISPSQVNAVSDPEFPNFNRGFDHRFLFEHIQCDGHPE
jgi:hypothetical protein